MKNILLLISSIALFSCNPVGNGGTYGPKIKAKLIRVTCATTVIQVLDSGFYNLGEMWIQYGTADTVEHAAQVFNKCEFPALMHEGTEFYFKQIHASDANNNCAVCAMYDYPPTKGNYLRVVD